MTWYNFFCLRDVKKLGRGEASPRWADVSEEQTFNDKLDLSSLGDIRVALFLHVDKGIRKVDSFGPLPYPSDYRRANDFLCNYSIFLVAPFSVFSILDKQIKSDVTLVTLESR